METYDTSEIQTAFLSLRLRPLKGSSSLDFEVKTDGK